MLQNAHSRDDAQCAKSLVNYFFSSVSSFKFLIFHMSFEGKKLISFHELYHQSLLRSSESK